MNCFAKAKLWWGPYFDQQSQKTSFLTSFWGQMPCFLHATCQFDHMKAKAISWSFNTMIQCNNRILSLTLSICYLLNGWEFRMFLARFGFLRKFYLSQTCHTIAKLFSYQISEKCVVRCALEHTKIGVLCSAALQHDFFT